MNQFTFYTGRTRAIAFTVGAMACYFAAASPALAALPGVALCNMISTIMLGQLGSAIATVGVLVVGIGAVLGRVSWQSAVVVSVGISMMFSVGWVVSKLSNGLSFACY